MREKMLERFFQYIKIDTQSKEGETDQYPSTEKQKDLLKLLVDELRELGLEDAAMDNYGYVTATFKSNLSADETGKIPVIGFLAHVDTSPDVSGKNVKPVIHKNYEGGDIILPGNKDQVVSQEQNPELAKNIGNDIITSDGTTLLGADNKAGIAEIMTMLQYLNENPEIRHGILKIGFTPDEEVGMGIKYFNVEKFGADYAYTVDGEKAGEIENETFNASLAVFKVSGINMHPGYAKGKLVNSIRIISDIVSELNKEPAPETTEKREGYLHPYVLEGGIESSLLKVLIRDFKMKGIEEKVNKLREIQELIQKKYTEAEVKLDITEQYRNMRLKLDKKPEVVKCALEAVKRSGIEPHLQIIRGGTDGARLCYKGLPTPNIFTGGMNFHSKLEWIPVPAMEKAVETLVNLVQIWAERK